MKLGLIPFVFLIFSFRLTFVQTSLPWKPCTNEGQVLDSTSDRNTKFRDLEFQYGSDEIKRKSCYAENSKLIIICQCRNIFFFLALPNDNVLEHIYRIGQEHDDPDDAQAEAEVYWNSWDSYAERWKSSELAELKLPEPQMGFVLVKVWIVRDTTVTKTNKSAPLGADLINPELMSPKEIAEKNFRERMKPVLVVVAIYWDDDQDQEFVGKIFRKFREKEPFTDSSEFRENQFKNKSIGQVEAELSIYLGHPQAFLYDLKEVDIYDEDVVPTNINPTYYLPTLNLLIDDEKRLADIMAAQEAELSAQVRRKLRLSMAWYLYDITTVSDYKKMAAVFEILGDSDDGGRKYLLILGIISENREFQLRRIGDIGRKTGVRNCILKCVYKNSPATWAGINFVPSQHFLYDEKSKSDEINLQKMLPTAAPWLQGKKLVLLQGSTNIVKSGQIFLIYQTDDKYFFVARGWSDTPVSDLIIFHVSFLLSSLEIVQEAYVQYLRFPKRFHETEFKDGIGRFDRFPDHLIKGSIKDEIPQDENRATIAKQHVQVKNTRWRKSSALPKKIVRKRVSFSAANQVEKFKSQPEYETETTSETESKSENGSGGQDESADEEEPKKFEKKGDSDTWFSYFGIIPTSEDSLKKNEDIVTFAFIYRVEEKQKGKEMSYFNMLVHIKGYNTIEKVVFKLDEDYKSAIDPTDLSYKATYDRMLEYVNKHASGKTTKP